MATAFTDDIRKIADTFSTFAENNIATLEDLYQTTIFPLDLWETMGDEKLLALGIPEEYGGIGGNGLAISAAGHALVKHGNNLGIGLSCMMHQLVARYIIDRFGTREQKETYLPDLASGTITACLAVSEPQTGAHPKHLKTLAEKNNEYFTINGEKTYLTNGPIADIFIVIAITGLDSGKKQFTAFIIPKEADGLDVFGPIELPFFRPAPHGGILLKDCTVHESAIIGKPDSAYEDMILPFREIEDAIMMGPVTGALEKQSVLLAELLNEKKTRLDEFLKMDLGKLKTMLDTAKIIASEAALMADSTTFHEEKTSLTLFFRNLAKEYHVQIEIIIRNAKLEKAGLLEIITNDLAASSGIGGNIIKSKQMKLGATLYSENG